MDELHISPEDYNEVMYGQMEKGFFIIRVVQKDRYWTYTLENRKKEKRRIIVDMAIS